MIDAARVHDGLGAGAADPEPMTLAMKQSNGKWASGSAELSGAVLSWAPEASQADNDDDGVARVALELDASTKLEVVRFGLRKHVFEVEAAGKHLHFAATSEADRKSWQKAISLAAGLPVPSPSAPTRGGGRAGGRVGGGKENLAGSAQTRGRVSGLQGLLLGLPGGGALGGGAMSQAEATQRLQQKLRGHVKMQGSGTLCEQDCAVCQSKVGVSDKQELRARDSDERCVVHKRCFYCSRCAANLTPASYQLKAPEPEAEALSLCCKGGCAKSANAANADVGIGAGAGARTGAGTGASPSASASASPSPSATSANGISHSAVLARPTVARGRRRRPTQPRGKLRDPAPRQQQQQQQQQLQLQLQEEEMTIHEQVEQEEAHEDHHDDEEQEEAGMDVEDAAAVTPHPLHAHGVLVATRKSVLALVFDKAVDKKQWCDAWRNVAQLLRLRERLLEAQRVDMYMAIQAQMDVEAFEETHSTELRLCGAAHAAVRRRAKAGPMAAAAAVSSKDWRCVDVTLGADGYVRVVLALGNDKSKARAKAKAKARSKAKDAKRKAKDAKRKPLAAFALAGHDVPSLFHAADGAPAGEPEALEEEEEAEEEVEVEVEEEEDDDEEEEEEENEQEEEGLQVEEEEEAEGKQEAIEVAEVELETGDLEEEKEDAPPTPTGGARRKRGSMLSSFKRSKHKVGAHKEKKRPRSKGKKGRRQAESAPILSLQTYSSPDDHFEVINYAAERLAAAAAAAAAVSSEQDGVRAPQVQQPATHADAAAGPVDISLPLAQAAQQRDVSECNASSCAIL